MARLRKRFYVARKNGGGFEVLSLKHLLTSAEISYSHTWIEGPFRTFDAAVNFLEKSVGVNNEGRR